MNAPTEHWTDSLTADDRKFVARCGNATGMSGGPYLEADNIKFWKLGAALRALDEVANDSTQFTPTARQRAAELYSTLYSQRQLEDEEKLPGSFAILCSRSGDSIFGKSLALLKDDDMILTYPTVDAAKAAARELNRHTRTPNVHYTAIQMHPAP
jgi:hypothetical protein